MSITFSHNALKSVPIKSPCLCAQFAEGFSAAMEHDFSKGVTESLRKSANPDCPYCAGSGVETVNEPELYINWNEANAAAMMAILRLDTNVGSCDLPTARRALIRARNTDLSLYTRSSKIHYGKPKMAENGTVDLKPIQVLSGGLTLEGIHDRLAQFENFIAAATEAGATVITWS